MRNATRRTGRPDAVACLLLAASGLLSGCATPPPPAAEPDAAPTPVVAEPVPPPPAPVAPVEAPPAPAAPQPPAEIALIVDTTAPVHAPVADAVEAALPARRFRIARFTSSAAAELAALRGRGVTVIAVGVDAVRAAREALPDQPLVFCQVPADDETLGGGQTWGVEPLPPLALQLRSWQAVDPTLRTVALIVSAAGAALAEEARTAAASLATDLIVETSESDRETLYLFRRLATTVDGLWLLPDNDALSPQVLRELLRYASSRGVGVLTFNEALLARGALLSATAVPADVAATVARVVDRVVAGRTADLPPLTPLSAAELTVNVTVAATLGLPPVAVPRWVTRVAD